jgi:hypothetical protein
MANGSNSIARLVIRIYSIIANSSATEYNFSDYSNIQTQERSLLKIEKVHKTNVLRMDILRCHTELGYTESRGKKKLGCVEGAVMFHIILTSETLLTSQRPL